MFGNDRTQLRKVFLDAWQAHRDGVPLDTMQTVVVNIIGLHPEYHALMEDPDAIDRDYTPEAGDTNPFLHMSMHIALHEQVSTDRPQGISVIYNKLCVTLGSDHAAEHAMMECLGEALWNAQRSGTMPDEPAYLACLKQLIK